MAMSTTRTATVTKIKTDLRITHSSLDSAISDLVDECLADLDRAGIDVARETNVDVLSAVKLYAKVQMTDDVDISEKLLARYERLKASLAMHSKVYTG